MPSPPTNQPSPLSLRQRSWAFSLLLHGLILCLSLFITCSPSAPEENLVEIQFGGSGGIPGLDEPIGETPQGEVDGGNRDVEQQSDPSESEPTTSESTTTPPVTPRTDDVIPSDDRPTTDDNTTDENPTTNTSDDGGERGTNNSDKPQGTEDGAGEDPAGGGGGGTIGISGGGMKGRGWHTSPYFANGMAARARGTVTVTLRIMADGRVHVTNVSGGGALASQARALAKRAKAHAAEPGTPPITTTVTYTVR